MADVHVYLPDDLQRRAMARDDLNFSQLLRRAVIAELDDSCPHSSAQVVCADCGALVETPP